MGLFEASKLEGEEAVIRECGAWTCDFRCDGKVKDVMAGWVRVTKGDGQNRPESQSAGCVICIDFRGPYDDGNS